MILSEEQVMLRDSLREFCRERIVPFAADWDRDHAFPADAIRGLAELGVMGLMVPDQWQGAGMDAVSLAIAIEEIAAADCSCGTIVSVQNSLVIAGIMKYGNDEQKARYLPRLATGELLGCFCLTEPQAGSDAAALRTSARQEGDEWVIDGVKQFITSGKHAQVALVFAVTDKSAGRKGMSCFIVDTDTPGYKVARIEEKLGQHASDTAEINFEGCRVPAANMLGQPGDGYRIALSNLEGGRIGIAAQSLGVARAALEAACAYAAERETFGVPIIKHQAVSFRLADMATKVEAARQLIWHAASLKDAGRPCLKEASMAKLFASEIAERVCSDAIQVHGGYGYVKDFPVERFYRDVRVTQIYEGTSDIQRMVIARALESGDI
ncbi:MAG: acyl-CoA dehydrogenase family protein [Lautropia sp.]|nr:acyl-CoA dehydrogenase family protein [Lautropia sp.]